MNAREQLNRLNQAGEDMKATGLHWGRNLWLAGLGVVGGVDEKGREVFADWVRRGSEMGTETEKAGRSVLSKVKDLGPELERRVEDTMSKTLNRLGVPARHDVEQLSDRVATLTRQVESLRH